MVRVHRPPPNPRRSNFKARHLLLLPLPRGISTPQLPCHAPRQPLSSIHTPRGDGCFCPFLKRKCTLSRLRSSNLALSQSPSLSFLVLHLLFLRLNRHVCSSLHVARSLHHLLSTVLHLLFLFLHFTSPLHIISPYSLPIYLLLLRLSSPSLYSSSLLQSIFFVFSISCCCCCCSLMCFSTATDLVTNAKLAIRRRSCRRNDVHVRRWKRTRSHLRGSGALRRESRRKRRFLDVGRRRRTAKRRTATCETPWPWAWTPWDSTSKTDTWVRASANVKSMVRRRRWWTREKPRLTYVRRKRVKTGSYADTKVDCSVRRITRI